MTTSAPEPSATFSLAELARLEDERTRHEEGAARRRRDAGERAGREERAIDAELRRASGRGAGLGAWSAALLAGAASGAAVAVVGAMIAYFAFVFPEVRRAQRAELDARAKLARDAVERDAGLAQRAALEQDLQRSRDEGRRAMLQLEIERGTARACPNLPAHGPRDHATTTSAASTTATMCAKGDPLCDTIGR